MYSNIYNNTRFLITRRKKSRIDFSLKTVPLLCVVSIGVREYIFVISSVLTGAGNRSHVKIFK
jgi:hypothetical protein